MSRIRAGRFRRRGPRRLTDWISGSQGWDEENPVPATPTGQVYTIINNADISQHDDRMTLIRIVGHVYFRQRPSAADQMQTIAWGIYASETDATNALIQLSPTSLQDANSEAWMHRRTVQLGGGQEISAAGVTYTSTYESSLVDIRVMRKLEGLMGVVLSAAIDFSAGGGSVPVIPGFWLRSLVKLT